MDVTEQRRAEAALRASEARLRLALDAAAMVAWEWDIGTGEIFWMSDPVLALNLDAPAVRLAELSQTVPAEDLSRVQAIIDGAEANAEVRIEHRFFQRDGGVGWIESYARVVERSPTGPHRIVGVSRDITRRKRLEDELRRREQQFSALVENSPEVIFRCSVAPRLAYEYISPAIARLTGYPPGAFLGDPLFLTRIVHPDDRPAVDRMHATLQVPSPFVIRLLHRDGALIWVELNTTPIVDAAGAVVALEGVVHNITTHKQLELALLRQTRLQGMLAASLRVLHGHGHDEPARQRILGRLAAELCRGVDAAHVLIFALEAEPVLRLVAAAGPDGALGPGDYSFDRDVVAEAARALAGGGEAARPPHAVPAFAPIVGADERYYLLPISWPGASWGMVAIGMAPAAVLDGEHLALAAAVLELAATTLRRWMAVDALSGSERQLRLAVEAAQLGTWELQLGTGRITISDQNARILGLGDTAASLDLAEIIAAAHPDDQAHIREQLDLAVASGSPLRLEIRVGHPDGGTRWVQALGQALKETGSLPARMFGVVQDITQQRESQEAVQRLNAELERRVQARTQELERTNVALRQEIAERERAEAALRDGQRFLERVLAAFPAQLYVFDYRRRRLIFTNKSLPSLLGYPFDAAPELDDYPIETLLHPDDLAALPSMYARYDALSDDAVVENEFRLQQHDGSWRWFASRDIVFDRGGDGRPTQMLGAAIEITARKRVETKLDVAFRQLDALNAELRHSGSLLRTIVNSLDDGLALIGEDGRILLANKALHRLCGDESAQILGRRWREVRPFNSPLVEQALAEGLAFSGRERVERDKVVSVFDIRAIPLAAAGAERQMVLHLVDVTERLQFEELGLKNERLAAMGRLAAVVAHEVNSPLQAIQNFLFLAAHDDYAERDASLAMIADEIDRIGGLIRRLLDLQRPGDDVLRALDANALIERVLALTSSTMGRHRVLAARQLSAEPALVRGRSDQLTQVLLNLILNALDTMPHGGELAIRSRVRPASAADALDGPRAALVVEVEVADTGHGIPDELLPRIFEPFFTTKSSGSGLGLAISRQIIEQHGGHLRAANREPRGATFTLVIPALPPGSDAPAGERGATGS